MRLWVIDTPLYITTINILWGLSMKNMENANTLHGYNRETQIKGFILSSCHTTNFISITL